MFYCGRKGEGELRRNLPKVKEINSDSLGIRYMSCKIHISYLFGFHLFTQYLGMQILI